MTKAERKRFIKKAIRKSFKLILKYGLKAGEIYLQKELEKLND